MAHLTEEQVARIHTEEKGDVLVNVEVRLMREKAQCAGDMCAGPCGRWHA